MKRPSHTVLKAMFGLSHEPQFISVMDWLKESLAEQREANDKLKDPELGWRQGECQTLSEIIKQVDAAAENLKKIAGNEARRAQKQVN